jgi:hypothetical protein
MPICGECAECVVKLKWCKIKQIHLRHLNKDLPCDYFKQKPINVPPETVFPMAKVPTETDLPVDFFAPRWISRYIVLSIKKCGDMSLAYDLLIQDASKELKERLATEK